MIKFLITVHERDNEIEFNGMRLICDENKSPPTVFEKRVANMIGLSMQVIADSIEMNKIDEKPYVPIKEV